MANTDGRIAGCVYHHIGFASGNQRLGVVGYKSGFLYHRITKVFGFGLCGCPTGINHRRLGLFNVEIGYAKNVQAVSGTSLRQKHRTELARANKHHSNRFASGSALA